mmetsp:Transcript_825/g.2396  ORF Transcript_825/g.2396 Transcript_825/m.2396 type:complete len:268 (+) Transcript_825:1602-2405(+)
MISSHTLDAAVKLATIHLILRSVNDRDQLDLQHQRPVEAPRQLSLRLVRLRPRCPPRVQTALRIIHLRPWQPHHRPNIHRLLARCLRRVLPAPPALRPHLDPSNAALRHAQHAVGEGRHQGGFPVEGNLGHVALLVVVFAVSEAENQGSFAADAVAGTLSRLEDSVSDAYRFGGFRDSVLALPGADISIEVSLGCLFQAFFITVARKHFTFTLFPGLAGVRHVPEAFFIRGKFVVRIGWGHAFDEGLCRRREHCKESDRDGEAWNCS